jgi:hypothetical protein
VSLNDIIGCAPFRLPQPRALTRFEISVVGEALARGFGLAGVFPPPHAEIQALLGAIMTQQSCPRWKTSMFGPAPAVSTYAYRCLASWYAKLDPVSKGNVLADIVGKGLLCNPNPPWASCPSATQIGGQPQQLWEGAPQEGVFQPGDEICAGPRRQIAYLPLTGQELLDLFELYGGGLPPQLQQAKLAGTTFLDRSFLIGIEARPATVATIGNTADPLAVARALTEEAALIWAPGRGASVRFLLEEQIDGAKLNALISAMMPDLLPDLLGNLGNILPGLIPPPDDPIWGNGDAPGHRDARRRQGRIRAPQGQAGVSRIGGQPRRHRRRGLRRVGGLHLRAAGAVMGGASLLGPTTVLYPVSDRCAIRFVAFDGAKHVCTLEPGHDGGHVQIEPTVADTPAVASASLSRIQDFIRSTPCCERGCVTCSAPRGDLCRNDQGERMFGVHASRYSDDGGPLRVTVEESRPPRPPAA